MDIDWGGLKILGFFGFIMALVAYDIIKTGREIEADKRRAAAAAERDSAENGNVV